MGCMFRFTLCCIANCGNELGNYYIDRTFILTTYIGFINLCHIIKLNYKLVFQIMSYPFQHEPSCLLCYIYIFR